MKMRITTGKRLKIAFIVSLFYITVFGFSFVSETNTSFAIGMPEPKAGDISTWIDTEAINISYSVLAASASFKIANDVDLKAKVLAENLPIYFQDRVIVRASTFEYNIFEMSQDYGNLNTPIMYNANPEFLQAYYEFTRITGDMRFNTINNVLFSGNSFEDSLGKLAINAKINSPETLSKVSALLKVMQANNESSASGYNAQGQDNYAAEDLDGDLGDYVFNTTDTNVTSYSASIDPSLQKWASLLAGNTSKTDLFEKSSDRQDKIRSNVLISGFSNFEEDGFLAIFKANKAAEQSTASDQITPDRIVVLDYTAEDFNMTNYFKEEFRDNVLEALDEAEVKLTTSTKLMGFEFNTRSKIIAGSGFFSSLARGLGKVFTDAKTFISVPLKAVADIGGKAVGALGDLGGKVLSGAKGAAKYSWNTAKWLGRGLMSTTSSIVKGGTSFVAKGATTLYNGGKAIVGQLGSVVSKTGKFLGDGVNAIVSLPGKIFGSIGSIIMYAALAIGGFILLFVVYKVMQSKKNRAPNDYIDDSMYRY